VQEWWWWNLIGLAMGVRDPIALFISPPPPDSVILIELGFSLLPGNLPSSIRELP
jgi:hypothetical protein